MFVPSKKPPTEEQLLDDVFDGCTESAYELAKRGEHETFVEFITFYVSPGEMNRYAFDTMADAWARLEDERRLEGLEAALGPDPT